ncbi:MAG TPA: prepilin-type N-terminal cleavage/methylation domain-containing protein [Ruminiclostridium sp.]|nr:prepilin-type N-terminal cleavage/methylation domain-containing protein [Ruminiclostridium sp.]
MFKSLFKKVRKSKGGFTLIELIAVIAILGILAVILIPTIGSQVNKAKQNAADTTANSIFTALQLYQNDENAAATLTETSYDLTSLPADVWSSRYFTSIKKSSLKSLTVTLTKGDVDSGNTVSSVSITDNNNKTGTYPKS